MAVVDGLHHIAFLTADLDRLIAFYERTFDAEVIGDREDGGRRHALIAIGEHTVLHPFEVPADRVPGRQAMFERGRLDHLAFNAATQDAFLEIRRRLIAEGAHATSGGLVTDMGGSVWSFSFHDPGRYVGRGHVDASGRQLRRHQAPARVGDDRPVVNSAAERL
jgi:catechol 2,3-dioxygenase-like lactoylglutathione lyase family enzyme